MRLVRLGVAARIMLTLPLIRLSLARGIRLRLRFSAERRIAPVIVLGVFPAVLARLAFGAEIRLALPKLLLGRGDQPEIMLGVLIVVFGRDRIAGRLGVAGKLDVFFGDVGSGSADFHVGTVRLVDPGQGVLALAVAPAHAFVLTVSHGSLVHHSLLRRSPASSRVSPAHTPASLGHLAAPARRKPASSGLRAELNHDNRSNLFAATSPRCCQPLIPRATLNGARQTGDAASRIPSRRTLALRGLSASPRRSLEEPCSGPLWRRVTVVSGRFRGRTVVGLAR